MKKTINGISYDTEKAKEVTNCHPPSGDFVLYKTKTGHFFLHERIHFVDGKKFDPFADMDQVYPEFSGRLTPAHHKRLQTRESITPLTRQSAIIWELRHNVAKEFHAELRRKGFNL